MIEWNNIFFPEEEKKKTSDDFSTEKFINKILEQSNINKSRSEFSLEAEEDAESAEDKLDSMSEDIDNFDESGGDDGGDFGSDEGGDSGSDSYSDSSDSDTGGVDKLDINKGSSLNSFTQINQKMYLIDQLNRLHDSINNSVAKYNDVYADWSELDQLKELAMIVDKERNSFIMQQNPENIIKLKLYMRQYETIVRKLSILIKENEQKIKK